MLFRLIVLGQKEILLNGEIGSLFRLVTIVNLQLFILEFKKNKKLSKKKQRELYDVE